MNRISPLAITLALALSAPAALADEAAASEPSTIKDSAKAAVSTAITAGKNLLVPKPKPEPA